MKVNVKLRAALSAALLLGMLLLLLLPAAAFAPLPVLAGDVSDTIPGTAQTGTGENTAVSGESATMPSDSQPEATVPQQTTPASGNGSPDLDTGSVWGLVIGVSIAIAALIVILVLVFRSGKKK